ncbi:MAG: ArsR/SmtB family transcription factor [Acidimicrobiia bacterium]
MRRDERVGAVFAALADPTRRELLDRLARTPANATELAAPLPVSRQAVVKHLQALSEAGLVAGERHGREVRWSVTPGPLADAMSWMVDVGGQWDRRLARLKTHLARK